MKTRLLTIIVGVVLLVGGSLIVLYTSRGQPAIKATGPLTTNEVVEITQLVLRERAPVIPGHFASPKDGTGLRRRLRERVAGEIRSMASVDGQTVIVDFGDRWNAKIGYDYQVERTTNGWKIVGVGWRGPSGK